VGALFAKLYPTVFAHARSG